VLASAEKLYQDLKRRYEVLYDDRDESPGVKFKDADLLGFPLRLVVSQKLLKAGQVELKVRQTGEVVICPQSDLEATLDQLFQNLQPTLEDLPYMEE